MTSPYVFFENLQKTKRYDNTNLLLAEITPIKTGVIRSVEYYNIMALKQFICEIIYNAINLFPYIRKYTITFKTRHGTNHLLFGLFRGKGGDVCMAKFFGTDAYIDLGFNEIEQLYCINRHDNINDDIVNTLIAPMPNKVNQVTFRTNKEL